MLVYAKKDCMNFLGSFFLPSLFVILILLHRIKGYALSVSVADADAAHSSVMVCTFDELKKYKVMI